MYHKRITFKLWPYVVYRQPAIDNERLFDGRSNFISDLGERLPFFKAAGTSEASHEMEGVALR
jgi:hypothetical protein